MPKGVFLSQNKHGEKPSQKAVGHLPILEQLGEGEGDGGGGDEDAVEHGQHRQHLAERHLTKIKLFSA